jgi:WD40 repeat protein
MISQYPPAEKPTVHDIFISHVEEDAELAIGIANHLEAKGFTTWYYEKHSVPGLEYLGQVSDALDSCKVVILVISPDSLGSHQVHNEVVHAYEERKRFIPVLHGIGHAEFQRRQPVWRQALGATTSVSVSESDLDSIIPRIIAGLVAVGITVGGKGDTPVDIQPESNVVPVSDEPVTTEPVHTPSPSNKTRRFPRRVILAGLIVVVLSIVVLSAKWWLKVRTASAIRAVVPTLISSSQFRTADARIAEFSEIDSDTAIVSLWRNQLNGAREQALMSMQYKTLKAIGDTSNVNGSSWMTALALLSDRTKAISFDVGSNPKIITYDVENGKIVDTIGSAIPGGLPLDVFDASVSSDNETLYIARNRVIHVVDLVSKSLSMTLYGHHGSILSVAISPGDSLLASVDDDSTILVWRPPDPRPIHQFLFTNSRVYSVAFSPDGRAVVASGDDGMIHVWELATGEKDTSLRTFGGASGNLVFSTDGERLFTGGLESNSPPWNPQIKVWSWPNLSLLNVASGHRLTDINNLTVSRDGSSLYAACLDTVKRLDTSTLEVTKQYFGGRRLFTVRLALNETVLLGLEFGGVLHSWDVESGIHLWSSADGAEEQFHTSAITGLRSTPNGKYLVSSAGSEATVRIWELPTGQLFRTIRCVGNANDVELTPDSERIIVPVKESVHVYRFSDGGIERVIQGHTGDVWDTAVSPDGLLIASCGQDSTIRLWHGATGQLIRTLRGHTGDVNSIEFSLDGTRILSGSRDSTVKLWRVTDGTLLASTKAHGGSVYRVVEVPNANMFVSVGIDGKVVTYSAETLDRIRYQQAHDGKITGLAVTSDGGRIVTVGIGGTMQFSKVARYWDSIYLDRLNTLEPTNESFSAVAVSPNGDFVYTGSENGAIRIWGVP